MKIALKDLRYFQEIGKGTSAILELDAIFFTEN